MKKALLLVLLLLIAAVQTKSQESKDYKNLSFAHFKSNKLITYGSNANFDCFFGKLDRVLTDGKGKVSIMHIGGSHVQADIMTHELRSRLLAMGSDIEGGRGLVFPFSAGKTNNPISYKTESTGVWNYERSSFGPMTTNFGLVGASLTTSDTTASITINFEEVLKPNAPSPKFLFNKIKVLGYGTGDVIPILKINDEIFNPVFDENEGSFLFETPDCHDKFTVSMKWGEGSESFTITGILAENDKPGITCHNIGVNGASLESILKCQNLERDMMLVKPDMVILAVGINDASEDTFTKSSFIDNYRKLVSIIKRVNPNCALVFVSNNDSFLKNEDGHYLVNERGPVVEDAMEYLAKQYCGGFYDLFYIMGGLGSMAKWEKEGLAVHDKVHFSIEGYRLLGDLLFDAIINRYMQYKKRNK